LLQVADAPLRALVPELPSRKRLKGAVTPGVGVTDPSYREVWEYLLWGRLPRVDPNARRRA